MEALCPSSKFWVQINSSLHSFTSCHVGAEVRNPLHQSWAFSEYFRTLIKDDGEARGEDPLKPVQTMFRAM